MVLAQPAAQTTPAPPVVLVVVAPEVVWVVLGFPGRETRVAIRSITPVVVAVALLAPVEMQHPASVRPEAAVVTVWSGLPPQREAGVQRERVVVAAAQRPLRRPAVGQAAAALVGVERMVLMVV
jgi:hypothetical protein